MDLFSWEACVFLETQLQSLGMSSTGMWLSLE
jgi:hypothetical protein